MTNPKWLKLAAQRSVQYTWTLGYVFEQYRKYEGKSAEELAAELGCSLDVVDGLSLCRLPPKDPERFLEELDLIEERFAVDASLLGSVIQQVRLTAALSGGGEMVDDEPVLVAARDHTSDDETDS